MTLAIFKETVRSKKVSTRNMGSEHGTVRAYV
jgi:hypothetical protein